MKRLIVLSAGLFSLTACDQITDLRDGGADIAACKHYVERSALSLRDTKVEDVVRVDEEMSFDEYVRRYIPDDNSKLSMNMMRDYFKAGASVRSLAFRYEPARGGSRAPASPMVCNFILLDGELESRDRLITRAESAANMRDIVGLSDAGLGGRKLSQLVKGRRTNCCLPDYAGLE